jgi:hypothetical protein
MQHVFLSLLVGASQHSKQILAKKTLESLRGSVRKKRFLNCDRFVNKWLQGYVNILYKGDIVDT